MRYEHLKETILRYKSMIDPNSVTPIPESYLLIYWGIYNDGGSKAKLMTFPEDRRLTKSIQLWKEATRWFKKNPKIDGHELIAVAPVSEIPEGYKDTVEFIK